MFSIMAATKASLESVAQGGGEKRYFLLVFIGEMRPRRLENTAFCKNR